MSISVVMPVYNAAAQLGRSLAPLVAMRERGALFEIIVVDDGSPDHSAARAAACGARVISSGGRAGPAAARNIGAAQARGTILWFVDADVVVAADAVDVLREGFSDPGVSATIGSYDDHPAAANFLSQYKNLVHRYYHQTARREASTFWSGCGAMRKQRFDVLGGFDTERFLRPSIEDIELGYRLKDAGGRIVMLKSLEATHLKEWRLPYLLSTDIFDRALPWSRLMLERGKTSHDLNVADAERIRAAIAGMAVIAVLWAMSPHGTLWLIPGAVALAVGANRRFLRFFAAKRGWLFALRAFVFHQLYYLYSGATFIYAWLESRLGRLVTRRSKSLTGRG